MTKKKSKQMSTQKYRLLKRITTNSSIQVSISRLLKDFDLKSDSFLQGFDSLYYRCFNMRKGMSKRR